MVIDIGKVYGRGTERGVSYTLAKTRWARHCPSVVQIVTSALRLSISGFSGEQPFKA